MSPSDSARLVENLQRVREQIAEAARRCGRTASDIRLVAVTKSVPAEVIGLLVAAGCLDLGESRPQELWRKASVLANLPIRWHLIGHLQRNKIARTLPLVDLVQSVDSVRLLESIDSESRTLGRPTPVLLEVNISGDAGKHGFAPHEVAAALERSSDCPWVQVQGLMGMASLRGGPSTAERDFGRLHALREQLAPSCPPHVSLRELSMGMSGDYAEAIAAGATIVRIGSALFEGVEFDPGLNQDAPDAPGREP